MSRGQAPAREKGPDPAGAAGRTAWGEQDPPEIGAWLTFAPDGAVEVHCGKAEVGQGIRTSLAQAVAEELRLPLERVRLLLGDTDRAPFDAGTFGSRTTPYMARRLRQVAASAREVLLDRAAAAWGVDRAACQASAGEVRHAASGRALSYAALAGDGPLAEPWSEDAPLTPAAAWTVAGRAAAKVDGRAFVTGRHQYTPDLRAPGMLAGAVLRPPAFGARLLALDTTPAEALPGVTVARDGDFVGVVAPDRATARRACAAIRAEWQPAPQISAADLYVHLRAHPTDPPAAERWAGPSAYTRGSLAAGRAEAAHTCEATYTVAYIAHAPLESRAALAVWEGGRLTVWTGTQRPFGVRAELAAAFGMPAEQVRVIVPDTGAAYGGKHTGEAAVEAARLARAAGRPVKLIWSREEEFTWAYFRPAGVIDVRSAVDASGRITAWEYTNYNSGLAGIEPPYAIANQAVTYQPCESPLRSGSYRALAATANHFARESHIDELAHAAGQDPLAFRLRNLTDARVRATLEAAAERFGWGGAPPPGHGYGLACGTEKGSCVAACVEVAVDGATGAVRLVRVVEAFECGAIVNPDGLENQVEGAVIQAMGGALFEAIDFADGRVRTDRFSRYRVPRFADVPPIEVVLVDRPDLPPAGAGETPIVGLAPAVANAIYAASGRRLRALPLIPNGRLPEPPGV
jgi:nicotinate dehydrogenase subunit B